MQTKQIQIMEAITDNNRIMRRLRKTKPASFKLKMSIAEKINVWKCEQAEGGLYWSRKTYRDPDRNILVEVYKVKYLRDVRSVKELKIRYGDNGENFDYKHLNLNEMKTILQSIQS